MSERDVVFDALYAIRDRGLPPLDMARLTANTQAAVGREIEREPTGRLRISGLRLARRLDLATVGVGLVTLVVVAIFVVAVAVLHRGASNASEAPSAKGLIGHLAVLRRSQRPADRLPTGLKFQPPVGHIIPRLTRLLASPPGARLFLVVRTPPGGRGALWSQKLGDQALIVAVTRYGASQTEAIPAAALNDAQLGGLVGFARRPHADRAAAFKHAYYVGIVPDGVAHVRWTFGTFQGKPALSVTRSVSDNVTYIAATQLRPRATSLLKARWYAANGAPIPTSGRALRQAMQLRQDEQRSRDLRTLSHYPRYRASASLLADFFVFSINSRAGVTIPTGLTISRPRLASLPLGALDMVTREYPEAFTNGCHPKRACGQVMARRPFIQPDLSQIRQVSSPKGPSFLVVPGREGMCFIALIQDGASGSCATLRAAERYGAGESGPPGNSHVGTYYFVLPKAHPTAKILSSPRHWRTIRPLDGLYIGTGYPEG